MTIEVSILIVNYKTPELVIDCVQSLKRHVLSTRYEIIVVDNESSEQSVQFMQKSCPEITIIANPENTGFGVGNNIGFKQTTGEYIFLLNSDTVLQEDSLTPLVDFLKTQPDAAIVGPTVSLPDGSRQPQICGNSPTLHRLINDAFLLSSLLPTFRFFQGIHRDHISRDVTRVDWISGVCMLIRREAFAQVHGFNPDFFLYSEDIDLCLRVNRDCGAIYHLNNYAIIHQHGASSKNEETKLRNSLMQQENFLKLLPVVLSAGQIKKARIILKTGLFLRLGLAWVLKLTGQHKGNFLIASCRSRLSALQGEKS